ncbi:hypothetical protein K2X92_01720 [Candidatus Gracilibacteria bacterium]|nr:hypothetical protein [Candidatus Gracilibacteria bacterium]
MPRITVAVFPDNTRTFSIKPYERIEGANILYYPEVSETTLRQILMASPKDVNTILSSTANI